MEEEADRDEQKANLKRYDEACLMMEPYLPDGNIDYPRCKIYGDATAPSHGKRTKICARKTS